MRHFSTIKDLEAPALSLSEHIAKYKSRTIASNYMDLQDLPELGNPLNKMSDTVETEFTIDNLVKDTLDFVGPEMVSPHYENFGMSRKVAATLAGVYCANIFFQGKGDIGFAFDYALLPFLYLGTLLYIKFEGRKSTMLPLLNRFYSTAYKGEIRQLMSNYGDNMNSKFRERESYAREQLEYFDLHKEFVSIKNEAISRLLQAEESYLKNHLNQRALNLLEGARAMEVSNQKKVSSEVLSKIKAEMKSLKENPTQDIKDDAFARALDGIRNGKLDYGQDLVLQKVLTATKKEIEKVNSLSESQKDAMLCLTEAQINSLKAADEMSQREYLKKRPVGLEGAFKEHSGFATTMANW
jgi:uncharacterized protein YnzC (UPF0291/DUF896 family)